MTSQAAKRDAKVPERPFAGESFVFATRPDGQDEWVTIRTVVRQTDQIVVFTIIDEHREMRWIRWDAVRACWVRSYGQKDGEAVPRA